jgi:hypothetical protein
MIKRLTSERKLLIEDIVGLLKKQPKGIFIFDKNQILFEQTTRRPKEKTLLSILYIDHISLADLVGCFCICFKRSVDDSVVAPEEYGIIDLDNDTLRKITSIIIDKCKEEFINKLEL